MKKLIFGFCACAAVAMITMAQSPAVITPSLSQVLATDGGATTPSLAFASQPALGFYKGAANNIDVSTGMSLGANFNSTSGVQIGAGPAGIRMGSASAFGWAATTELTAYDTQISRAGVGQFGWTAVLFANLGTPSNGAFCYCSDCTIANPCASGGTGALAKRLNGAWVCN